MDFTDIIFYAEIRLFGEAELRGDLAMFRLNQKYGERIRERIKSERVQRRIAVLNKYSLIFHVFLACGVCFLIEWISRHSFLEACRFAVDRNLVFLYNSLIVYASLMLVYIFKRRAVLRTIISVFWLFLGTINGCILAKRVSPFSFTDLKMVGDLFTMQSNYFTATEAVLVIVGVTAVVLLLIVFWIKGPKFKGKPHRVFGALMMAMVMMMLPRVTNAAVSNHILTEYFENLAQGYRDYGFVYSFSASVLDRGMSTPEEYSEEAVRDVLAKSGQELPQRVVSDEAETEMPQTEASERAAQGAPVEASERVAQEAPAGASERAAQGAPMIASEPAATQASLIAEQRVKTTASDESMAALEGPQASGESGTANQLNTELQEEENSIPEETEASEQEYPNIICILLESFVDPAQIRFLETSEDPIPNFHRFYENYSSGYLEVPVVGAGTANTEFEILTGMGMQFFGLGEYPYKTILKETNCESIASDLRPLGYGSHAVHDNGGNFYSRRNAFSMMGFDTFTCKEMMDIREYTPLGTWPIDDIMLDEVERSLDYTPDQPDFVYTITVESHGDYPKEQVIENPEIRVSGVEDEGMRWAWEYYVNQIHQVDDFVGDLIDMLEKRDEKTFVVMFGDHLPTMGLTDEDMLTGSLFKTQYATWNNFGLEKQDADMTSYQLLADVTDALGIHEGTMFKYHQSRDSVASEEEYQKGMELLQYDILYGDHYVYGGGNPYPATDLVMGTQDIVLDRVLEINDYYFLMGENFTKWSKVYIDDAKVSTTFLGSGMLRIKKDEMDEGRHKLTVCQVGSSDSIFRSSNSLYYVKQPEDDTEE